MKYIKLFEDNSIGVDYDRNVCWIIDGDLNNILSILYGLIDDYMKDNPNRIKYNVFYNDLEFLIDEIKNAVSASNLNNINGMILFSKSIPYEYNRIKLSFKFFKIFNEDVDRIINQEHCTLLGELRTERQGSNYNVILNTDYVRMKKYNL